MAELLPEIVVLEPQEAIAVRGDVTIADLPTFFERAFREAMETSYEQLQSWMAEHDLQPAAAMWECYLSDPEVERNPASWQTRIVWPVA